MEPGAAGLHRGEERTGLSVAVTKHQNDVGGEWLERVDPAVAAGTVRVEEDPVT